MGLLAQDIPPPQFVKAAGAASIDVLTSDTAHWWAAGRFQQSIPVNDDSTYTSLGAEDLFLIRMGRDEQQWVWLGGSTLEDEWSDLEAAPDGDVYVAGRFWQNLSLGGDSLVALGHPRALFLGRMRTDGTTRWAITLGGGGLKAIGSLATTPEGGVLVGGHFSDSLILSDTLLLARGRTDAFALQFGTDGQLQWARSWGGRDDVRGTHIACGTGGVIYLTGWYDDELIVGDTTLFANTTDPDVFLMRLDAEGAVRWVEKAGGVFEEEPTGLTVDDAGAPILTGFLVGRMTLNGTLDIESRDGNADIFVLRYDTTGRIQWARSIGGDQRQIPTGLDVYDGILSVCGHFQENLLIPFDSAEARGTFDAFLIQFDLEGQILRLQTYTTEDILLPYSLTRNPFSKRLILGGTYIGSPDFGDNRLPYAAHFLGFLAGSIGQTTPTQNPDLPSVRIRAVPNPTTGWVHLNGLPDQQIVRVINREGRQMWQGQVRNQQLDLRSLSPGLYILVFPEIDHPAVSVFLHY
jgi:hypothetical protein